MISTHLPVALRTFLLTLAVVDDLLAITVIAIFYTDDLDLAFLALSLVPLAAFGVLVQRRVRAPYLLIPLALAAWALMHESGVHATVAGVLLAFTVPVRRRDGREDLHGLAESLEHLVRPVSAVVAVPVFAFLASGVDVGGLDGLTEALRNPVALGVVLGLVRRQDGRGGRLDLAAAHVHPRGSRRRPRLGRRHRAVACWPASGSPCRC